MLDYDNRDTFRLLFRVCDQFAVDPRVPIESQAYFRQLLSEYDGPTDTKSIRSWLKEQMPLHFKAFGKRPKWIQNAYWPFANGQPMIFAGQINITSSMGTWVIPGSYHDDTSLYVFVGPDVEPEVIIQQY